MKTKSVVLALLLPLSLAASAPLLAVSCKTKVLPVSQTSVAETTTVTLDGSGSTPNSGAITSYGWSQPTGQGIVFVSNNPATGIATFVAPSVGTSGRALTFTLTINGATCNSAASEATIINVTNLANAAPYPIATTSPEPANEGDTVSLDGSASYDPDGDAITYLWTQIAGNTPVNINNATSAVATFVAPNTAYPSGTFFTFQLRVFDGFLPATTEKLVTVTWANDKPDATLSCPGAVNEGDTVLVDGSASSDPEGVALTYDWSQLDGPPYVPTAALTPTPTISFIAPQLGYHAMGFLPFRLVVSDGVLPDAEECTIQILDVTKPVISGASNQVKEATSPAGASASYNVTVFDNVDGDSLATCVPASPSTFPLGVNPVNCSATDSAGNIANASFTVTVVDTTAPTIGAHGDETAEATSAAGASVGYADPATSDNYDAPGTATCLPASGSSFPLGESVVTCSAKDGAGNQATPTTFKVTVSDGNAPVITPPADSVFEATAEFTPLDSGDYGSATAFDLVGVVLESNDAPPTFPLGPTMITWYARDAAHNSSAAKSTVTVVDTTRPVIAPHDPVGPVEATSSDGATADYILPTTADLVGGAGTANCLPASGATFALGISTVHCNASDGSGNAAVETTFTVKVVDTTPPLIAAHGPIGPIEATSSDGATADYVPPTTADLVSGAGTANCLPASGATFALGISTVHCNASDAAGNAAVETTFSVKVVDTTPPLIAAHGPIGPIEATSSDGAIATYTSPATTDAVDGPGTATCSPLSGSTFPLGSSTVTCSAADASGNAALPTSFTVLVVDSTAPVISGHGPVGPIEATSGAGATASYTSPATSDIVDGAGTAACLPASGATFALGVTTVHCNTSDAAGNAADETSFTVEVVDSTAPVIVPHGPVGPVEATSSLGATVIYQSPATADAVDGPGTANCLPASGGTFPLGNSLVLCSAVDAHFNIAAPVTFHVSVIDSTGPAIAPHADVTAIATANSGANVTYTTPTASDLVDGARPVSCEAASGTVFAVGSNLVTCTSSDSRGNTSTSSFHVIVSFGWTGFFSPVDNLPTVNSVKAGSAIPVKFSLGGNQGLNIFAAGYPGSVVVGCSTGAQDVIEETLTAGGSTLSYGNGQYVYVWKTDKSWVGNCRQLQVKLTDGSLHVANFIFK